MIHRRKCGWEHRLPLPAFVHLGKGYNVRIREVTGKQLARITGDPNCEGCWAEDIPRTMPKNVRVLGTLYVLRDLPHKDKWRVYWHELLHAIHDIKEWDVS